MKFKFILSLCSVLPFSSQWCKKDLTKAIVYASPEALGNGSEIPNCWGVEHIRFKICKLKKLHETHSGLCFLYVKMKRILGLCMFWNTLNPTPNVAQLGN